MQVLEPTQPNIFFSKKIYVKESPIHGLGVYAKTNIKKGDTIAHIKGKRIYKINKTLEDSLSNSDWVGFSKHNWVDPIPPYKYLNHSCEPNSGIRGKVTVVALQNIKKDDEILFDYSTTELDENWKMICFCKTASCRKIIKSIHSIPSERLTYYAGIIPTEIKKNYYNSNGKKK